MISPREKEILVLLACGYLQKQIAGKMGCSLDNILRICAELRCRFDCYNTTHLVAYALINKLITIENCIELEGKDK